MKSLRQATPKDLEELQSIARKAYALNFADHWNGNGLELYLEKEFGDKRLLNDLNDLAIGYSFILLENNPIGFTKVNYNHNPELSEAANCELEKIYILPEAKGNGIGKIVMQELIETSRKLKKQHLFLCVIDTNEPALRFYLKYGFTHHSKTKLSAPNFKPELKGMYRLCLKI